MDPVDGWFLSIERMRLFRRSPVQITAPILGEGAGRVAGKRGAGKVGGAGIVGKVPIKGAESGGGEVMLSIGGGGSAIAASSRVLGTTAGSNMARAGGFFGATTFCSGSAMRVTCSGLLGAA